MKDTGPVVVIEDDADDRSILKEVFKNLNYQNEIMFFEDAEGALAYLDRTDITPFLILSDINMPRIGGKALREKVHLHERLQLKCTPYLFLTTAADRKFVIEAYSSSVQGFFKKPSTFAETETTIESIMDYWSKCIAPEYT